MEKRYTAFAGYTPPGCGERTASTQIGHKLQGGFCDCRLECRGVSNYCQKARKWPVSDVLRDKRYTCFRWYTLPVCSGAGNKLIKIIYRTEHISNQRCWQVSWGNRQALDLFAFLYLLGESPVFSLKSWPKWLWDWKPTLWEISRTDWSVFSSNSAAFCKRYSIR